MSRVRRVARAVRRAVVRPIERVRVTIEIVRVMREAQSKTRLFD